MEKVYAEGIRTFKKGDKAPDFVLGAMVISIDDLKSWCDNNQQYLSEYNGKRQLKLQLTKSKEGDLVVCQVDTYKK
jgi:hypothetical protein